MNKFGINLNKFIPNKQECLMFQISKPISIIACKMQECLLLLDHSHFGSGVYRRTSNYEMKASPNPSQNNLFP